MLLQMAKFHSFLGLSNIPLCVCVCVCVCYTHIYTSFLILSCTLILYFKSHDTLLLVTVKRYF